jgi:hypothetical protein
LRHTEPTPSDFAPPGDAEPSRSCGSPPSLGRPSACPPVACCSTLAHSSWPAGSALHDRGVMAAR